VFTETPEEFVGFVYLITDTVTDKKYVGKKLFWKPKILPKNSRRKRRIKTRVPSDWPKYYGSSKSLQEDIETNGAERYRRDILRLCKAKGEMSYIELKEQIDREVLFKDDYYNEFIGVKIHSRHISLLKEEFCNYQNAISS